MKRWRFRRCGASEVEQRPIIASDDDDLDGEASATLD